jgi:hypothetical protein
VSGASPVHTALRNCIGDEGGPFGFGDQVADPAELEVAADPEAVVVQMIPLQYLAYFPAAVFLWKIDRSQHTCLLINQ